MSSYSLVWHSKPSGGIVTAFPSSFYIGLENSPDHKLVAICLPVCGMPRWRSGKGSACQCRRHRRCGFNPWVTKIPWRRKWQPTPVLLPGNFHGQRSLEGYSPWGHKEHLSEQAPGFYLTREASSCPGYKLITQWGSLVGCCLWGHTGSDTTEVT